NPGGRVAPIEIAGCGGNETQGFVLCKPIRIQIERRPLIDRAIARAVAIGAARHAAAAELADLHQLSVDRREQRTAAVALAGAAFVGAGSLRQPKVIRAIRARRIAKLRIEVGLRAVGGVAAIEAGRSSGRADGGCTLIGRSVGDAALDQITAERAGDDPAFAVADISGGVGRPATRLPISNAADRGADLRKT